MMNALDPERARVRVQVEYIEMPGLKLSVPQISRLCDIPQDVCEAVVALLVSSGFLACCGDGTFLRAGLGRAADGILGAPLARAS